VTDLDVYQPAAVDGYQARMVMTPDDARALDEQVRRCTEAVLREGTDYGVIPGTGGDKTLLKPGAEKLLQWFGLGFTNDQQEIERDADGRREGVTYRCTIIKRLPDGTRDVRATCEGYAGYDEDKFYQSAEQAQFKAEAKERMWAKKDNRVANPNKWKHLTEYRAPWNTVIKMAQKRALVGATIDATAAAGLFKQEEDDGPEDDGPTWYQQALAEALNFTTEEAGRTLYVEAARAARDGLCTPQQANHVQNRIQQRVKLLKTATPVDVEDLGRQAQDPAPAVPDETAPGGPAAGAAPAELLEDQPGTVTPAQLTKLHTVLTGLGFGGEDREQKLKVTEAITGRTLGSSLIERSSKNLSWTEARKVIDTLDGMDRDQLIAYMAGQEGGSDG
jgi:hypothetical protein